MHLPVANARPDRAGAATVVSSRCRTRGMSPPSNRLEASENRKQQAVEDIMKTQMTKAAWIGMAVLVMAAGGASRARADELVVVTVPFAFTAGSTQLPAGTYTVRSIENDPSVLAIESSDGRQSKILLTLAST